LASTDNLNGVALNSAIKSLIQTLDPLLAADVRVFDAYASIVAMMTNPSTYGFTQTTALCINNPLNDGCPTDLAVAKGYIQWDAAHKTTRVHELMAQEIVAQVPEPRTFVLLAAGLLALAWLRRRGRA
jgi:phospholipase/lecithinase/hemolysin